MSRWVVLNYHLSKIRRYRIPRIEYEDPGFPLTQSLDLLSISLTFQTIIRYIFYKVAEAQLSVRLVLIPCYLN